MSNSPEQPPSFMMDKATEEIWGNLVIQITPSNTLIVVSGKEFDTWSAGSKAAIVEAYSAFTNLAGIIVRDAAMPRLFIGPLAFFQTQSLLCVEGKIPTWIVGVVIMAASPQLDASVTVDDSNSSAAATNLEKIPRPPNAFILYRKHYHSKVVADNPGLHNNLISGIIGKMWNSEPQSVRNDYKKKADNVKRDHLKLHPGYTYKPRKSSEKKRRMTKKKAAALAAKVSPPTPSFDTARQFGAVAVEAGELKTTSFTSSDGTTIELRHATLPMTPETQANIAQVNKANLAEDEDMDIGNQATGIAFAPSAVTDAFNSADTFNMHMEPSISDISSLVPDADLADAWKEVNAMLNPEWEPEGCVPGDEDLGQISYLWEYPPMPDF